MNHHDCMYLILVPLGELISDNPNFIFAESQLLSIIFDIFVATEPVNTTVQWACAFLMEHPHVQERMRREIDEVVGNIRRPRLSDKQDLPYCQAVISEIQRCGNITPLSDLHAATDDVVWNNYVIPKGCTLMIDLDSIQNDSIKFPEPHLFKPERFLNPDGSYSGYNDTTMFFGAGNFLFLWL